MASRLGFAFTIVALTHCVLRVAGVDEASLLKSCWNAKYNSTPGSFEEWTSGKPSRIYMIQAWWSKRNRNIPLTVFTMTSLDRLNMLEKQCRGYAGPLSAAVYIPLVLEDNPNMGSDFKATADGASGGKGARRRLSNGHHRQHRHRGLLENPPEDPIARAKAMLQDFFERMESAGEAADLIAAAIKGDNSSAIDAGGICQLRLMLFGERIRDRPLAAIMPTNVMRNAAMLGAATPLSGMFDVDLGISASINRLVRNATWVQQLISETSGPQPTMFIPPAWEATGHLARSMEELLVETVLEGEKSTVVSLWLRSVLQAFQIDICPHCHGPFKHEQWASSNVSYAANYSQGFEPWGILWRLRDPGYDERFRGWLYDKQMHVEALAQKHGFRLTVLPDIWLIHRPHKKVAIAQIQQKAHEQARTISKDLQALLQPVQVGNGTMTNPYRQYRHYVDNLRAQVRETLAAHQPYEPQLGAPYVHCKSVLPWWRQQ